MELTTDDYVKLLDFYNMDIPKSKRVLKMNAVKILDKKLCRCIKKVDKLHSSKEKTKKTRNNRDPYFDK